jgi:hypothetical protein
MESKNFGNMVFDVPWEVPTIDPAFRRVHLAECI